MRCHFRHLCIIAFTFLLPVTKFSSAADWPQWRGPDHNGLAPKNPALGNSLVGLSPLWLADGIASGDQGGRGSLVVHAGKVYGLLSAPARGKIDEVFCLDAANGKSIWRSKLSDSTNNEGGSSTPCILNGKLYVVGSASKAYCLNVDNGNLIWESKLPRTRKEPLATSITVIGGVAVMLADVLMGLDAETGKVLWTQDQIKGQESSPVPWSNNGHNYVFCNTEPRTYCVDVADGRVTWSAPGGGKSTPVVVQEYGGDFLVILPEYRKPGLSAFRLSDKDPKLIWSLPVCDRGSSPVVFDGHVYAVAGGEHGQNSHLMSIHLDTGKIAWDEVIDFAEVSSPTIADGKVFVVCGTYLWLLAATPEKFSVLSQDDFRITLCTSPTVVDGRLYIRQGNAVACYDLRAAP